MHPRIIFISDGRPTSFTNLASAFVEDSPLDETENVNNILLYKFSINNHVVIFNASFLSEYISLHFDNYKHI